MLDGYPLWLIIGLAFTAGVVVGGWLVVFTSRCQHKWEPSGERNTIAVRQPVRCSKCGTMTYHTVG